MHFLKYTVVDWSAERFKVLCELLNGKKTQKTKIKWQQDSVKEFIALYFFINFS